MSEPGVRFLPAGDRALTVEFGEQVDPRINRRVRALDALLARRAPEGVVETVPTYRSLQIVYDPVVLGYDALREHVADLLGEESPDTEADAGAGRVWTIPVAYGGEHGIDLEPAAAALGLTPPELARRHAQGDYTVAMIGFQPGFAYLGGLPEALRLSRLETPRNVTPPGTVSIGGVQAAISSVAAPSAWHLLGQTPLRLFDPRRRDPFLLRPGDRVRFHAIDAGAFASLRERIERDPEHRPEHPPEQRRGTPQA